MHAIGSESVHTLTTGCSALTLPRMGTWDDAERAALVALLRARPNGLNWPQIMGKVDARSSAVASAGSELRQPDLLDTPEPELADAARDIAEWQAAELGFLTFLDADYPAAAPRGARPAAGAVPPRHPRARRRRNVGRRLPQRLTAGLSIASSASLRRWSTVGVSVVSGLRQGHRHRRSHRRAGGGWPRGRGRSEPGSTRYYPAENRALQDRIADGGPAAVAVLARRRARQAHLPDAQLGDVRLRPGRRSSSRRASTAAHESRPAALSHTGAP